MMLYTNYESSEPCSFRQEAVHAKDKKLLQDMRSCNGSIIAGPDQSLPAQIEFSIKLQ